MRLFFGFIFSLFFFQFVNNINIALAESRDDCTGDYTWDHETQHCVKFNWNVGKTECVKQGGYFVRGQCLSEAPNPSTTTDPDYPSETTGTLPNSPGILGMGVTGRGARGEVKQLAGAEECAKWGLPSDCSHGEAYEAALSQACVNGNCGGSSAAESPKVQQSLTSCDHISSDGRTVSAELIACAKQVCTKANNTFDNNCYTRIITGGNQENLMNPENIKSAQNFCDKDRKNAKICCSDLSSGQCEGAGVAQYMGVLQQAMGYVQQAANISSIQASCHANKKIIEVTNIMSGIGVSICTKQVFDCVKSCQVPDDCNNLTKGQTALAAQCQSIKDARNQCKLLTANVVLEQGFQVALAKAQADAQSCENQTLNDSTENPCDDPEQAKTNPGCLQYLCAQPGALENNPLCFDNSNQANQDKTDGTLDLSSELPESNSNLLDNPPVDPFEISEQQAFNGVDPNAFGNDNGEGGPPAGGAGGGNALPTGNGNLNSGGGGGGAGGNLAGGAGTGRDGKIIRGNGSGKGYISRFRGAGGSGGGYAGRRAGAGGSASGGRSLASSAKFNLENFLPKGKIIKKGAFKGFTRFPSGQLMVPQSKGIFEVHHQSYVNACHRNQAVKGCEFSRRKSLGAAQTLGALNKQYKAQLTLQKESKMQMLSRSGVKIKSLKNSINSKARETYFMIQYMKKNRLQRVPAKDPYASLSAQGKKLINYDKNKYAAWNKMKSWVNSQNQGRRQGTTPGLQKNHRLPASSLKK